MIRLSVLVVGLLLVSLGETFAASQQDYDDCSQADDIGRSVAACTRIIANPDESIADRAAALIQRGNDDVASGKLDEAIADYSGAIQLDAKSVAAYAARAIAHWRKNDRDHAFSDYNKAVDIDAAAIRGMTIANVELKEIASAAAPASNSASCGDAGAFSPTLRCCAAFRRRGMLAEAAGCVQGMRDLPRDGGAGGFVRYGR